MSNARQMLNLIDSIAASGSKLFLFPENALYFRIDKNAKIPGLTLESECFNLLRDRAVQDSLTLIVGSAPMVEANGRISNAMVLVLPNGETQIVYRKIHLFDVEVAGHHPVRESDSFQHGSEPQILELNGWRFGLSICYDLRFAELYAKYAKRSVDAILVPSAFLVPTGEAHWHVLLRARAIESQSYVLAPAQAGEHKSAAGSRWTYGHSLAVDPWGEVLMDLQEPGPKAQAVELSRDKLAWVRAQIPQSSHRRL